MFCFILFITICFTITDKIEDSSITIKGYIEDQINTNVDKVVEEQLIDDLENEVNEEIQEVIKNEDNHNNKEEKGRLTEIIEVVFNGIYYITWFILQVLNEVLL